MASRRELTELGRALRRELKPLIERGKEEGSCYGDFGGACGLMSYALYTALKRLGRKPVLALAGPPTQSFQHCWVEVDGLIVDLTATQFGYTKPVQVTTRPSEWHKPFLCRGQKAVKKLRTWDGQQNPLANRHVLRNVVDKVLAR